MKNSTIFCLTLATVAWLFWAANAIAFSDYYTTDCAGCHGAVQTCAGCHAHGVHSSSAKNDFNLTGTTDNTTYAPGETVTVTINGGYRGGWVRTLLYDQNLVELARSAGTVPAGASAPAGGPAFPVTLTAPAPAAAGTYTWTVAWYGNVADSGGATFGANWTPDTGNPDHGRELVSTNAFTVATAPPPTPTANITLNPTSLDFGSVVTGASAPLTTDVANSGTADLTVTTISLCPGTSPEFTWSPQAPFTATPGSGVTLSVTYAPVDTGTDTGCLNIASNDPDSNPAVLNLTGTGVVTPPPAVTDLDIRRFTADTSFKLREIKGKGKAKAIDFRLVITNAGMQAATAPATLIGVQNGEEVYRQTVAVATDPGKSATFDFPGYMPTVLGDIAWTVTVDDADPDVDQATAVTIVRD